MSAARDLEHYLSYEVRALTEACTTCGRCVDVCPVAGEAGVANEDAKPIVSSVLDLINTGEALTDSANRWVEHCNGCGACIDECSESVNPRRLLMFAQCAKSATGDGVDQVFRKLAKAVRLMAAMQLPPDTLSKLFNHRFDGEPDVIFYTGCNALRTPHVLLNAMQILEALEVNFQVAGGPANCCGIAHTRTEGKIAGGGQVMGSTMVRFETSGAKQVLSWCPSCQLQMGETWDGFTQRSFELEHISSFLVEHSDELVKRFVKPSTRKVVLHAHQGLREFGEHVENILRAIPGINFVDSVFETGYTCGVASSGRSPELTGDDRKRLKRTVDGANADTVVTLYHSCHRSITDEAADWDVDVINFTDLVVEALGRDPYRDAYQELQGLTPDAVWEHAQDVLKDNGVKVDQAWMRENFKDLWSMAEYRGGLNCLVSQS